MRFEAGKVDVYDIEYRGGPLDGDTVSLKSPPTMIVMEVAGASNYPAALAASAPLEASSVPVRVWVHVYRLCTNLHYHYVGMEER